MSADSEQRASGDTGKPERDRRGARRLPADRSVYFTGKETLLQFGQVTEISRGGMRIDAAAPLPVGAEIEIELLPKDQNQGTPLVMRGRVVHHEASAHGTGMGVRVWGGAERLSGADATVVSAPDAHTASWAQTTPSPRVTPTPFPASGRYHRFWTTALGAVVLLGIVAAWLLWHSLSQGSLLHLAKSSIAPQVVPSKTAERAPRRPPISEIPPGVERRFNRLKETAPPAIGAFSGEADPQDAARTSAPASSPGDGGGPAELPLAHMASVRPFDQLHSDDVTAATGDGMGGPANDSEGGSRPIARASVAAALAPKATGQPEGEPPAAGDGFDFPATTILAPPFSVDLVRGPARNASDDDSIRLLVDKSDHALVLYRGGRPLRVFPVGLGRNDSTPGGLFHIANKLTNPDWYTNGKVIPGGSPLNRIGKRWMGLAKDTGRTSYGIHPAKNPETVGRDASLGCIQMTADDAETLFRFCPVGTEVIIQP